MTPPPMTATTERTVKGIRWRSMDKVPKSKGTLWVLGSDGNHYAGYFEDGSIFTKAPGWVTFKGWRRTSPPKAPNT